MRVSVAICIYNDFDFLVEGIDRIYDLADEIVILDGPYEYCKPMLKYFDMYYEEPPEPLKGLLSRPKVRYEYRTFEDERQKRMALYEMCRGDVVMLLDSDELVTQIRHDNIAAFLASDKSVAGARFHNHVRSNVLSTEDTRKLIFFKKARVSAAAHLNYTWLVGVEQEKPNRDIIFERDRPLLDVAHLTLMRSPYHSTVKYCFYTRLYFHSRGLVDQIDKLFGRTFAAFAERGLPMETIRDIFRRSVTDSLNFPEREKLRLAPPSAVISPDYDKVADIAYLDEATEAALLNGVKTHYYVRIPAHLKAGDPVAFSFTGVNVQAIEVEGVFHDGDRCERIAAQVRKGANGVLHGSLVLPFDGGGRFGALIVFRPRCADPAAFARVSGFRFKKRLGFYGNCQTENVIDFLNSSDSFLKQYEVEPTPGRLAHMMSDDDISAFHKSLHRLDYLILQPIADSFRGEEFGTAKVLAGLRRQARVFMMPNLYFTAYAPDSYCVTYRKQFMQEPMPIHDVNFIYSYLKHGRDRQKTKSDYIDKLSDQDFYSDENVSGFVRKNVAELRARERDARARYLRENTKYYAYSDFIERECERGLMHYSDLHPTEYVFASLAREILADLQVVDDMKPVTLSGKGTVPFYSAIGKRFGFDAAKQPIYLNNTVVSFDTYFERYCDIYDQYDLDELAGYISRNTTKVVITNHKTGTMLMIGILMEYCKQHKLKLLDMNQHLHSNNERIDPNLDFQSFDVIFLAVAPNFITLTQLAPRLRYRAIHLVRHPLEIIMSGVRYHQVTDEPWCRKKVFVADPAGRCGYRQVAGYDVEPSGEVGEFSYQDIMNCLPEREKIEFEIRSQTTTFDTIPSILRFLKRFSQDHNVESIHLEDIASPECIDFVFRFLALAEDFLPRYRNMVGAKNWLGKHVTNRAGGVTHLGAFDEKLLALFATEFGADAIKLFGYGPDSAPPVYQRAAEVRQALSPQSLSMQAQKAKPDRAPGSPEIPVHGGATDFYETGERALAEGRLDVAKAAYERSLKLDPQSAATLGRLGDICVRLGQYADALDYYRRIEALVENPPAWLYIGLGNALEALGERRAALDSLQQAVRLGVDAPSILKRVERLGA